MFEKRSKHSSISIHSWVPICTLDVRLVPTLYIQVQGKSIKLNFCHELSFIWLQGAIHRNQFVIKALQQIQYQPVKEEK